MWTLLFVLLHCRLCTEEENLLLEWEKKEQKSLGNSWYCELMFNGCRVTVGLVLIVANYIYHGNHPVLTNFWCIILFSLDWDFLVYEWSIWNPSVSMKISKWNIHLKMSLSLLLVGIHRFPCLYPICSDWWLLFCPFDYNPLPQQIHQRSIILVVTSSQLELVRNNHIVFHKCTDFVHIVSGRMQAVDKTLESDVENYILVDQNLSLSLLHHPESSLFCA